MDNNKILLAVTCIVVSIFGVVWMNSHIKGEVDRQIQKEREVAAKTLADKTVELENKRVEEVAKLKDVIITLESDNKRCKIELQESQNKKDLKELSKRDPKRFKQKIDEVLGVKGKK